MSYIWEFPEEMDGSKDWDDFPFADICWHDGFHHDTYRHRHTGVWTDIKISPTLYEADLVAYMTFGDRTLQQFCGGLNV